MAIADILSNAFGLFQQPQYLYPGEEIEDEPTKREKQAMLFTSIAEALGQMTRGGQLGPALAAGAGAYGRRREADIADRLARQQRQREQQWKAGMDLRQEARAREAAERDERRVGIAQEGMDLRWEDYFQRQKELDRIRGIEQTFSEDPTSLAAAIAANPQAAAAARVREEYAGPVQVAPGAMLMDRSTGAFTQAPQPLTPLQKYYEKMGEDPDDPLAMKKIAIRQGLETPEGELTPDGETRLAVSLAQTLIAANKPTSLQAGLSGTVGISGAEAAQWVERARKAVRGEMARAKGGDAAREFGGDPIGGLEINPNPNASPMGETPTNVVTSPGGEQAPEQQSAQLDVLNYMQATYPNEADRTQRLMQILNLVTSGQMTWMDVWDEIQNRQGQAPGM